MSKRLVTILWVIVLVLASLTLLVKFNQNKDDGDASELAKGDALLEKLPLSEIVTIKLEDVENSVTLQRDDEKGQWSVVERAGYKADFPRLTRLLRALTEVTVAQSKKAGPAFNERFGMDSEAENQDNHGYQIVFSDADGKELKSLAIGKSTAGENAGPQGGSGKYIRLGNEPDSVYTVNESFYDLTADPKEWLDGNFIAISGIRSIKMEPGKESGINGWTISRPNAGSDFTIQNLEAGREPQADKLTPLKNVLSNPGFEDILTDEDAKAQRNESKANMLVIKTFEGFEYRLDYAPKKAGEPTEDGVPLAPAGFIVKIEVSADFPEKREQKEGESAEEAKKADADFIAKQTELKEKLEREKAFAGSYFEMASYTFSPIDLGIDALAKPVVRTQAVAPTPAFGPLAPQPPLREAPPTRSTAVSPVIEVPPTTEEPPAAEKGDDSNNSDALNGLTEEDILRIVEQAKEADAKE